MPPGNFLSLSLSAHPFPLALRSWLLIEIDKKNSPA